MRVVAATGNRGKLAEFDALTHDFGDGWQWIAQAELGIDAVAETGATFVDNAMLKARHACAQSGLAALGDDSGLAVDALGGAPGIYSARYAGENASDADNIEKLLRELSAAESTDPNADRRAHFHCALVFISAPDATPLIAEGVWHGRIVECPAGENGFGYDPIFFIDALGKTAAQLDAAVKNNLSHRAQALRQLKTAIIAAHTAR